MMTNPYANYKQQAVATMTPGEQVITLFDEALKNIRLGSRMYTEENFTAAELCTEKSKHIFEYLSSVLNRSIPISDNLYQLYDFIVREIIRAQIRRDPAVLDGIVPIVDELRDTWVQADKLSHQQKS